MKMAKASEADLEMAMKLANYCDAISRGHMPDALSLDAESIEWLETSGNDQFERLREGLTRLLNQGSIFRVVFGMAVLCDPKNRAIDPDADTLEEHPYFVRAERERDELQALLVRASASLGAFTSDHGWSQADMDTMDSIDAAIARMNGGG